MLLIEITKPQAHHSKCRCEIATNKRLSQHIGLLGRGISKYNNTGTPKHICKDMN